MAKLLTNSDNRNGSISAVIADGSDNDPIEDQYSVEPGEYEYKPIERDLHVRVTGVDDDYIDVRLYSASTFTGLDRARSSFDKLEAHSKGVVDYSLRAGQHGDGFLTDHVAMGFCVEDKCQLRIVATVEADVAGPYVSLKGPGIELPVLEHGKLEQTVTATGGEYELQLSYGIRLALPNANAEPGTRVELRAMVEIV